MVTFVARIALIAVSVVVEWQVRCWIYFDDVGAGPTVAEAAAGDLQYEAWQPHQYQLMLIVMSLALFLTLSEQKHPSIHD